MPLPPALAARLAKRGLLRPDQASGKPGKPGKPSEAHAHKKGEEEEVFAESYDDHDEGGSTQNITPQTGEDDKAKLLGYPGCPNKWNPYHECQPFCSDHWGSGHKEPSLEYLKLFQSMMKDYQPLPEEWEEQYDPGSGRHFFWNRRTDRVSWFPPGHPKARIMEAASQVRELLQSQLSNMDEDDEDDDDEDDDQAMDLDSDMSEGGQDEDEEDRQIEDKHRREKEQRREQEEFYKRKDGKRKKAPPGIDPMDPSSYSDAPLGTWASGLDKDKDE
ncbi:polyglutamine-binding protein 1-like [Tigriopus californicus]|uniref:polyglutamine-binding protein 1-like n=1 Tax=Tigriopus californicus TaxID=6832 RepID=UPI0027DA5787|nr:polyglutamine-binding protein 1-like [Tigriopus californicus]|eukprot:TCALIF_05290-PA protein Name:"Similar to PQBP1 Polyglutamine-binding protein 1 (Homo sapiens)" AED:0.03 eAED:0.03 QI:142/1/1/1/1/1/4/68/273